MSPFADDAGDHPVVPDTFPTEWLIGDIDDRLRRVVEAAAPPMRHSRDGDWRNRVIIHRYKTPDSFEEVFRGTTAIRRIYDASPDDLRSIADEHRAVVQQLLADIDLIESTADAIDQGDDVGRELGRRMAALRDDAEDQQASSDAKWDVARGEDGVWTWDAIDYPTRSALMDAGLLSIAMIRVELDAGELHKVKGIGSARLAKIAAALKDPENE